MTFWLTVVALFFSTCLGGVFFAFSSFVMPALGRVPTAEGIRAMQRINVDVFHPSFMLLFFATPLLCLALGVLAAIDGGEDRFLRIAGGALFLVGCFGVTVVGNVPLNEELAKADPESATGHALWERYLRRWVWWNHVRTVACFGAAAAFLAALCA